MPSRTFNLQTIKTCFYFFFSQTTVVIQNGELGPSVPQPVEMGATLALVLVPILLRALVERTVHNWGLTQKLVNATVEAAQVLPI